MPHIHWVTRGTGTPEDKDEVNIAKLANVMGEYVI
jgi:hypothetical protein